MKITPSTRKKELLYPMAAAVVLASCQPQEAPRLLGGACLPQPEVQLEPVVKQQQKQETTRPQRVVGKKAVRQVREQNQPLPGKRRATR